MIRQWQDHFTMQFRHNKASFLFVKGIVLYALIKLTLIWPVVNKTFVYHTVVSPGSIIGRVLILPAKVFEYNPHLFFAVSVAVLLLTFILRPNYITHMLFFWICLSLIFIKHPVTNGSDFVLAVSAWWSIFLVPRTTFKNGHLAVLQIAAHNLVVLLTRIQICMIYFVSGYDKVKSEMWLSGDAFYYIARVDVMLNPSFSSWFTNSVINLVFSWATIVFELAFVVLVWLKYTRKWILLIGVLFHLCIWVVLSLPDFGLLMMLTYLIFYEDNDWNIKLNGFKQRM